MSLRNALSSALDRIRSSFLGGLLIIALGVTGVVTWHAYHASKEYKSTVTQLIDNYVTMAAYQLGESTQMALSSCTKTWFRPTLASTTRASLKDIRQGVDCQSTPGPEFELDLQGKAAPITEGGVPAATLAWLRDTIPHHPTLPYNEFHSLGVLAFGTDHGSELIVYVTDLEKGLPTHVVGFVAQGALAFIVGQTVQQSRMLPPRLTKGNPASSFFSVNIPKPGAAHPVSSANYAQQTDLGVVFGNVALRIGLQPSAINQIIPDGIPRNRGWELLALLSLASGLVLASLLLLQREAQLARMRENFVSSVSHELRTPLTQIRMFAEMLLLGRVRNEVDRRRSLEIIDKEARRLSQLVENVLQVARSERGAVHVTPIDARVAPIIREAVEGFLVLAESRRTELRLELQEDLMAPVDASAVKQIMVNLLDNAVKYGPEGQRVVVGLAMFENVARLWVDDEGPGVPIRERERVFEAFYRSTRDLHSATTGSGIGLAVVRELATLHGGSARIDDTPHSTGARIIIELPGAYVAAAEPATDWAVA